MPIDKGRGKRACDFNARMAGLHGLLRKCQIAANENVDISVRLCCCNLREFRRHPHCSLVQGKATRNPAVGCLPTWRLNCVAALRCNFCAVAASKWWR
jgi:hypothetical protein